MCPVTRTHPVTRIPTPMTAPDTTPLLEARRICKDFPGVRALHNVDLRVGRGEVLALLGENGAGKSTLMKILAGILPLDSGELFLDAQPVRLDSVRTAVARGIVLIHQELNLADNLDVGANIFLGREPHRLGILDRRTIYRQSAAVLGMVGLDVSPKTIVATLPIGKQQLVEIAKALSVNARLLIMDEPTSSLSAKETEVLFRVVRELRSRGVSVIYISHRLGEVQELADRVVVLRDGENAGELKRGEIDHDRMVRLMVGRDISQFYGRRAHGAGPPVLQAVGLETPAHAGHRLNFSIRAGELVGLAGLVGVGTHRIAARSVRRGSGPGRRVADRRPAGRIPQSGGRDSRGRGARARGQKAGRPDRRHDRPAEHQPALLAPLQPPTGPAESPPRAVGRQRHDPAAEHQDSSRRSSRPLSVRRQPAKGRAGEMVVDAAPCPAIGRAHARDRRGRQGRDLRLDGTAGGQRRGDLVRVKRNGRGTGHVRSRAGHARRPAGRRTPAGGTQRGGDHELGDRWGWGGEGIMKKALGIFALLVFVYALASLLNPDFLSTYNIQNTLRRTSLFGIISIGVALVIITGGIDLSLGSLVGLIGCLLPMGLHAMAAGPPGRAVAWTLIGTGLGVWCVGAVWLHSIPFRESLHRGLQVLLVPCYVAYYAAVRYHECKRPALLYMLGLVSVLAGWFLPDVPLPPWAEVTLVVFWMLEICAAIGLLHGVLITRVGLQPFVVTLCGLLFYRGVARWLTDDQTQGFGTGYEGLKSLVTARPCSLASLVAMAGLCLAGWGLYRWIGRRENDEDDAASVSPWCLTLVGLTLSLTSVLSWLPGLPEAAPDVPTWTQRSMFWIGLLGSVGGVVGLSLRALLRRSWGVLWGDALTLTGLLVLWRLAALGYVGSGDPDLAWWKIMLVGLALIALMFGVARFLTANWKSGLRQRSATFLTASAQAFLLLGMIPLDRVQAPAPLLVMLVIAILAGFFLNQTLYGRYLLALGRNEEAARYSGINTAAMTVLAYVLCTLLSGRSCRAVLPGCQRHPAGRARQLL